MPKISPEEKQNYVSLSGQIGPDNARVVSPLVRYHMIPVSNAFRSRNPLENGDHTKQNTARTKGRKAERILIALGDPWR